MKKFAIVTRGRTGSTAVIDELGKIGNLCTTQELFLRGPFNPNNENLFKIYYKLIPPFDLWKQNLGWKKLILPNYYLGLKYLNEASLLARKSGSKGFGWKVLSHHFDERPFLIKLLKRNNYNIIYLRRNSTRQVLSGMVANQRGIFNSQKDVVDNDQYYIDIERFKLLVKWERESVKKDCDKLSMEGFKFIEVSYENFSINRKEFYDTILRFLDLPIMLPPSTSFVKMIKDPKLIIKNYDEVSCAANELGEAI